MARHPEQRRGLGYIELSGTSQAAAVVAGAAALVLEANPNLNPRQVKLALQGTASLLPQAGVVAAGPAA